MAAASIVGLALSSIRFSRAAFSSSKASAGPVAVPTMSAWVSRSAIIELS
jgi:hypothetical protein